MVRKIRWVLSIAMAATASAFASAFASAQDGTRAMLAPPRLPLLEWNACPFEGCTYGKWKAEQDIAIFDTWMTSRRRIGTLKPGDSVLGLMGVVITFRPGVVRIDSDGPPSGNQPEFKRGDRILTYTYRGEGETAAWFKGTYYENFDITFAKWPAGSGCNRDCLGTYVDLGKKEWWAKISLRGGKTAWVLMDGARFSGVDALAAAP